MLTLNLTWQLHVHMDFKLQTKLQTHTNLTPIREIDILSQV